MAPSALQPGDRVAGRYLLLASVGEGGMAVVFEALDEQLQRRVALKVLRRISDISTARFEREARAASALNHPAVVRVFGFGTLNDGRPYLALELIEGEELGDLLRREERLGPERALHMLLPVVGALAEAHVAGIVHRDLKPSNLLVQRASGQAETLRLLDFGIAAWDEHDGRRLTRTGEVFGTPEFMSPEQALSRPVGPATDVWAIGAVLYELLTGRAPFQGTSPPSVLYKVVNEAPPALPDSVPAEVAALVMACLSKAIAARPTDGADLLRRMEALLVPARRELASSRPPDSPVPLRPSGGWAAGPPRPLASRSLGLASTAPITGEALQAQLGGRAPVPTQPSVQPAAAPEAPPAPATTRSNSAFSKQRIAEDRLDASVPLDRVSTLDDAAPPGRTHETLPRPPRAGWAVLVSLLTTLVVAGGGLGLWWALQPPPAVSQGGPPAPADPASLAIERGGAAPIADSDHLPPIGSRPAPPTVAPATAAPATEAPATEAPATEAPRDAAVPPAPDAGPPSAVADAGSPPPDAAPPSAAPPSAAPPSAAPPSAPDEDVAGSLEPARALLARGDAAGALTWLARHPRNGTPTERLKLEFFGRMERHDMGRAGKLVVTLLSQDPTLVDGRIQARLLADLPGERYWQSLVPGMADKRLYPRLADRLMAMTRQPTGAGRWRALEVITRAKGDWRLAKTNILRSDLERADGCSDRKVIVQALGRAAHPSALSVLQVQRKKGVFDNLCMGHAIDDAMEAIRKRKQ